MSRRGQQGGGNGREADKAMVGWGDGGEEEKVRVDRQCGGLRGSEKDEAMGPWVNPITLGKSPSDGR